MPQIETAQRVQKVLVDHLCVDVEQVTPEANLVDDLGADSLDFVELAMAFEEEFDLKIKDDEVEKWATVEDVIKWLDDQPQK